MCAFLGDIYTIRESHSATFLNFFLNSKRSIFQESKHAVTNLSPFEKMRCIHVPLHLIVVETLRKLVIAGRFL